MKIIITEIGSCGQCPFLETKRRYTPDSFDNVYIWNCIKSTKEISGYVENFDKVLIPEWCELENKKA